MKPLFFLGIDPGVKTGLAVWNVEEQDFEALCTSDFWAVYDEVMLHDTKEVVIIIEDPGRISKTWHAASSKSVAAEIGRRVGANCEQARLLIERFTELGYTVHSYVPTGKTKRGGAWKKSKEAAKHFKDITGYEGRTNEHTRDAGMMVYGLSHY